MENNIIKLEDRVGQENNMQMVDDMDIRECKQLIVMVDAKEVEELKKVMDKYDIELPRAEYHITYEKKDGKYHFEYSFGFENYAIREGAFSMEETIKASDLKEYFLNMLYNNFDNMFWGNLLKEYLKEDGIDYGTASLDEIDFNEDIIVNGFVDGDFTIVGFVRANRNLMSQFISDVRFDKYEKAAIGITRLADGRYVKILFFEEDRDVKGQVIRENEALELIVKKHKIELLEQDKFKDLRKMYDKFIGEMK